MYVHILYWAKKSNVSFGLIQFDPNYFQKLSSVHKFARFYHLVKFLHNFGWLTYLRLRSLRNKLLLCSLLSENDAHRVKTITISLHKRIYKMKTKSSTSAINPITIIEKIKNTPKKSYIHTKSQRPRSDLDKRSLSRPNTTKAV